MDLAVRYKSSSSSCESSPSSLVISSKEELGCSGNAICSGLLDVLCFWLWWEEEVKLTSLLSLRVVLVREGSPEESDNFRSIAIALLDDDDGKGGLLMVEKIIYCELVFGTVRYISALRWFSMDVY